MRYCTRCLYPANHPFGIIFDDQGVCSGCRIHEEKDVLDWEERYGRLGRLLRSFRSVSGKTYDCVVPVSGARDSFFVVHVLKRLFGMRPLLVHYNIQYNTRLGIRNLACLKTVFDCDFTSLTVDPATVKKITRATMRRMGSIYWHCHAGRTAFPVQTAARFKIPLVVWGVHQGLDQVGMFSHLDEVEMTRKYRKEHDLMGWEAEDLAAADPDLGEEDVRQYAYPDDREIEAVGIRGIFLGNYIRWDSIRQHELMIREYGYATSAQQRTFDIYNNIDCHHYSGLHDYVKFLKFGYGKATDHACREIRLGRLTREQGVGLALHYRKREPADLHRFLEWVRMDKDEFFGNVDVWRDPRIWCQTDKGWRLQDGVENHLRDPGVEQARLALVEEPTYQLTSPQEQSLPDEGHILYGRGFED